MQAEPHPRHIVAWVALALAVAAILLAGWQAAELRKLQRVNEALHAAPPRLDDKVLASVQQLHQEAKARLAVGLGPPSEVVMFERLYNKARQRHGDITEEERQRLDQPLLAQLASALKSQHDQGQDSASATELYLVYEEMLGLLR